ncbi:MAG: helix-turn-helix transcriptional regulator [Clostridia bacterium]|nr:helix-turn-helix transcriptional regulator [Clostridia bacterium]
MKILTNPNLCKYVNRIRLTVLHCGYATVGKEWTGTVRNPVYSRLYYAKDGEAIIGTDKQKIHLMPGNWYLLPAGVTFDFDCEKSFSHIFFHIKLFDYDEVDLLRNVTQPIWLEMEVDESICRNIGSNKINDWLKVRQSVDAVLLKMLDAHGILVESEDYSPCIFKALQYIKQNLSMQLTISNIAEGIFVSKSTLTKRFQKELSMSVNQYIHDTVMFQAVQLLRSTDMTVLAVSEKFGFSDQFYFSRCFKAKFGMSPREFRKTMYI